MEADDRAELQDLVNCPDVPATVANAGVALAWPGVAFWNRQTLDPASAPLTAAAIRARKAGLAGHPAAVLISADDVASIEETLEILGTPGVAGAIQEGRADADAGRFADSEEIKARYGAA